MLEQIKNISIKGGPFTEKTSFDLFPQRLNLLYGRNGSGKSTIAKSIRRLGKEDDGSGYSAETNPSLSAEQAQHIFVFDEDFVSTNFRMNETGLSSIVMLGKQVGLDEQLQVLKDEQDNLMKTKSDLDKKMQEFSDNRNSKSPAYYWILIKKDLSKDGGWAEQDKLIKGNLIKSQVTDTLVNELMELRATAHYSVLLKEFEEKFKTLQNIKKGGSKLNIIPSNVLFSEIEKVKTLLDKRVEEPRLDSRDKAIIELVRSEYGNYLNQIHPVFDNSRLQVCPLCLRPMDKYDKEQLFSKIQQFFNKNVEDYKLELQHVIEKLQMWHQVELADIVRELVGQDTWKIFRKYELELQNEYSKLLTAFEERMKNVYGFSTSYLYWYDLISAQEKYSVMLDKINAAIKHYNLDIEQKKKLTDNLIYINKAIAARSLKDQFSQYRQHLAERNLCESALRDTEENLWKLDSEIAEILSKKAQVSIALDFINEALAYIFFNNKRLVLENFSGQYRLKSNGKDVKPGDVSTGERNAIALCYFFAKIFERHEKDNRYKDEMLVVLDDPITSFDKDNKVGMMTFLRWQVNEIYNGCNTSKILIMSHDLMTVFDIHKIFQDINAKSQSSVFELKNKIIGTPKEFNNLKSEYKKLMDDVFSLANGSSSDFIGIGNKMRRIEEAYSTFVCNRGFVSLLHDDDFLQKVPPSKRRFYHNFMSRLVLNSESHTEEKSYSLESFAGLFSEEEIRKTAKYLLMLFYYVDEFHLKSYLGDNFEVVKAWADNE